ncbi:hypothetical protein [Priestia megaterium]|uniref:hypothetical protein n=1 Tax=Priestia megaterium TaxID=1404 RepID=UPI001C249195|nr:hypothetical protein [Priestia megaterium]MBU8589181.1 hypothetical protein [Priestia megaterium]
MSIINLDKCVAVEEKAMVHRREELYKLIQEIMDELDLETLMINTLSKIAFIDYLLGIDVMENKCFNSMIDIVNSNRKTNYQLHDFYIRF